MTERTPNPTAAKSEEMFQAERDKAWENEIARLKEKYPPDDVKPSCKHEWDNEGMNPTYCLKCGMSLIAHAFLECP